MLMGSESNLMFDADKRQPIEECTRLACNRQSGSDSEIHLHVAFVLLRRARGVQRNLRHCIARVHEAILDQVLFDFFTANIGQHFAVNLNTG